MRFLLLLFALSGCLPSAMDDVRRPCPDDPEWDPNRPLALRWGESGLVDLNEHIAQRIAVSRSDGSAVHGVPFAFAGGLGFCVPGGLPVDADLTWTVTDGSEPRVQEWDEIRTRRSGDWAFHTAAESAVNAPETLTDCAALMDAGLYDTQCEVFDTGDSGRSK